METTKKNRQGASRTLIILIIMALVLGVLIFVYSLNRLRIIPTSEGFTELYFEKSSALPKQIVAGRPILFSFTIHNMEGNPTIYPYSVYFENQFGGNISFASGEVTLGNDASTTINASYIFPSPNEKGRVVVDLTSLNQQIDFLLPNNN